VLLQVKNEPADANITELQTFCLIQDPVDAIITEFILLQMQLLQLEITKLLMEYFISTGEFTSNPAEEIITDACEFCGRVKADEMVVKAFKLEYKLELIQLL
jgi:hypothetical protein